MALAKILRRYESALRSIRHPKTPVVKFQRLCQVAWLSEGAQSPESADELLKYSGTNDKSSRADPVFKVRYPLFRNTMAGHYERNMRLVRFSPRRL